MVDTISNVDVTPGSTKPLEDVIILELNIIRQGAEAKQFDAADTWNTELPLLEKKRLNKIEDAKQKAAEDKKIAEEKIAITAKEMNVDVKDYKSKAPNLNSGLLIHNNSNG